MVCDHGAQSVKACERHPANKRQHSERNETGQYSSGGGCGSEQSVSSWKIMSTLDQKLLQTILVKIDSNLSQGILPVHNGHLKDLSGETDVLEYLLFMKKRSEEHT